MLIDISDAMLQFETQQKEVLKMLLKCEGDRRLHETSAVS